MRYVLIACLIAGPCLADAPQHVRDTAARMFERMPLIVEDNSGSCGRDASHVAAMAYCTSDNAILVRSGALTEPDAAYRVAHLLGHAIQVQHGIADIALRTIRARPEDEAALRGMVTRQVECLAGVLVAQSGLPTMSLHELFEEEPHTGSHWGRNPLRIGPQVSIGLDARAAWFDIGQQAGRIDVCAVGEVPIAPLLEAMKAE